MRRRSWGTFSYLRQYYFDDKKLKELAIAEFVRAMRSGRLIAFTGSMTTTPFGYPTWDKLLDEALGIAAKLLGTADRAELIPTLRNIVGRGERFDARVAYSAVAQMLDQKDHSGALTEKALKEVAGLFSATSRDASPEQGIVSALFDELHIDRVVTTNYDLELEAHAMGFCPRRTAASTIF